MLSEFSMTYFGSMEVNLKSMLWMDVKMFVAPCTTHSRVSGIAIGVHQERKTGSFREHNGKTPEKWPSTRTTYIKYWFLVATTWIKLNRPKWGIDKFHRYLPSDPQIAFDVWHYERHSFYTRKSFFQWMVGYKNFLQVDLLHLMKMYHYPEVLASILIEWKHDLVCQ